jgi:hypothetical protein
MDKHSLPKKKRHFPLVALSIAAMSTLFAACEQVKQEPAPAAVAAAANGTLRTKEQAMAALMALPELKAWSERIEKSSGGKLRGALMEYDTQPKVIGGKRYWQFSFVENGSDAARLWESFLVSDKGDDILVDDAASEQPMTLAAWREQKRPMEQTGAL